MTTFQGANGVKLYRALACRRGLQLYERTGIKPNTAWTPTAMLTMASHITGKVYKRRQYRQAISDLTVWIEEFGK